MNSRQRVLAALSHQEPDRLPIDLNGMRSTGIMAIAYNQLKAHLGITGGETVVYDIMQQLAMPESAILERFGVDVLPLPRLPLGLDPAKPAWKPWTLPDGSQAQVASGLDMRHVQDGSLVIFEEDYPVYRMPAGAVYFEPVHHPLATATSVSEVESYQPKQITNAELEWLRHEALQLRQTSDKAIMGHAGVNIYEGAQNLRGWEKFMLDLGENPELAQAVMQRLADQAIENLDKYLDAVGDLIDIIQVGDDLGTQNGPQLSPAMYRRLVKPFQKQVYQFIHTRCDKPIFLHSCGGIYPLIPDLIDAGVNILNPVQISAVGMDPVRLKREFGKDLVFWGGGVDTQKILPYGTPEEVRRQTRELIEIFSPGGGYVFCAVHNIQAGVPAANIIALYEEAILYNQGSTL